ncbi:MAG: autotransporter assembly complex family protein [Pseudomonadota bacterium]
MFKSAATILVAVGVSVSAVVGLAGPAHAFELFGVRLFGKDDTPPPPPGAISYSVTLTVPDDSGMEKPLKNGSRLIANEKEKSPGPAALLATARGDYQRLLGVLYSSGRYGGTISITIDGREAANLPIDAEIGDGASVDIVVDPGPVYLFDNVTIANRPGPIANDRTVPPTPEELGLKQGEPARSTVVLAAEQALIDRWREKAHPKARIADRTATAVHPDEALDVAIHVAPGRSAVFGDTFVEGTDRLDPAFVAYFAGITPGEPYDPDDLERARRQLRRLDVFKAVRIVEADQIADDGSLPITLLVDERKRRVYGGGVRFSSIDGLGLEGYWRHRNLFGRAEQFGIEGRTGGINGDNPDEYNYLLAANFLKPGVFTPYTDFVTRIYAEQLSPDTFRARTLGGRLGLQHRFSDRLTGQVFAQLERSYIDRISIGDGNFLMASLPTALNYDGSDNELNPTEGYRLSGRLEPYYEFRYDNVGVISELVGTAYYGVINDRVVFAGRAAVGSIVGAPIDEIPANRAFFAGGGGSIRGYPYRGVGPIDANGKVIGGRSYFVTSAEARIQVTQTIGVVPFIDAGNAFLSEYPDFSEPLRIGVGAGLRYQTGLGPIRFDVAFPLERLSGEEPVAFYLGLGQAF